MISPPNPLALLICDHAWRDPHSGKHSLLGTFSALGSSSFRLITDLTVYFAVTEGQGSLPVCMELVDVDEERQAVFDVEGVFEFMHLRHVREGTFTFSKIVIPKPGEYRLKMYVGGEFLMERELHVEQA